MKKPTSEARPKSLMVIQSCVDKKSTASESGTMSLLEALNDKRIKIGFRKFLESEFSVENLDFWYAVEDFKSTKSREMRKLKTRTIYEEYISPGSPSQINLDYYTKQQVMQHILSSDLIHSTSTFDAAQKYVFCIMENDSYARFVRSKYYDICNSPGRRSPRKFIQDFLLNSSRSRERSPSPLSSRHNRFSVDTLMSNNSNNKNLLHVSDSNLEKDFESSSCRFGNPVEDTHCISGKRKLARSDSNLSGHNSDSWTIFRSFLLRLRAK